MPDEVGDRLDGHAVNNNWALPGGTIDLGESASQVAIRETQEETGITCEITGLVGIYTEPRHVIHYMSNAEVRQEFSIVLTGYPELQLGAVQEDPEY